MLSEQAWHQRFVQQVGWTAYIRKHLIQKYALTSAERVLEVGCGTGALLDDLRSSITGKLYGLDLNLDHLFLAKHNLFSTALLGGDAFKLPFNGGSFDWSCCHFLLLWLEQPSKALLEMKRVTRAGGYVIAFAEPDYEARIDYPAELSILGQRQRDSLRGQGAQPDAGRKLGELFQSIGLKDIETGIMGAEWHPKEVDIDQVEIEWNVLENDLIDWPELYHFKEMDLKAWMNGSRILFVPTFYAVGRV
jgi:ubiquinone/menaquinone biosynthesis C-methylase UbiE